MRIFAITGPSLTLPNLITLLRLLLTPLFIIFLIQESYGWALTIFVAAGVSDLMDGLIARQWHQKSPLGAFLDPLADKVLMASSFLTLSIYHLIPSWLTVVVLSRDVALGLGVAVLRLADFPVAIRPTLVGKWCTTFQILTVFLVLGNQVWRLPTYVLENCFWITGGLTVASGMHYVYRELLGANQPEAPRPGGE